MSLDVLTLAAAKKYTDSQRLGYTETVKKIITWDGNTEGKASFPIGEDTMLYKVSDEYIKITSDNLIRITADGRSYPGEIFTVINQTLENDTAFTAIALTGEETALVVVADKDVYMDGVLLCEKGVWFGITVRYNGEWRRQIQAIEIEEEVIHKIDKKFIPEGGVGHDEIIKTLENEGKIGKIEILKHSLFADGPTNVILNTNEDLGGLAVNMDNSAYGAITDIRWDVHWDGVEYSYKITNSSSAIWIGNHAFAGEGEDTGEPFLVIVDYDQNVMMIVASEAGLHKFNITRYWERVVPINKMFIPGMCLPFVDLGEITRQNDKLYIEVVKHYEKLDSIRHCCAVISFIIGNRSYTGVTNYRQDDGATEFIKVDTIDGAVIFTKEGTVWTATISTET